jgi:hypothetical protein
MRVTDRIPLGRPLPLTVTTVNSIQTLKAHSKPLMELAPATKALLEKNGLTVKVRYWAFNRNVQLILGLILRCPCPMSGWG